MSIDPKDALDELHYWLQLIDDIQANIKDAGEINEIVGDISTNALLFASTGLTESQGRVLHELVKCIEPLQNRLEALIDRCQTTGRLIDGRMKMLRKNIDVLNDGDNDGESN